MNSIESGRELAENKLILLYIIHNLETPVANLLITKIILENKLMNYIFLQQYLDELCEGKFLEKVEVESKPSYNISAAGQQSLEYFTSLIPAGTKSRIDEALTEYKKHKKYESNIEADFVAVNENEFIVNMKISEGNFTYIDLKLTVGNRNDAKNVCNNWIKNSEMMYRQIISIVTEPKSGDAT